ncbi:MAG TPA: phosphate ABC transporter permease subunit PstC [Leptospiraceae bacterium]|nr:phosphate ABC transporter permease subunit PstC [Leptospiraceae bacterium]HMW07977.1 phosphate ABC transporter permease subunit PstC [Leptospiraceae bacterium]HMX34642.1 phosphate ABC transporter permease subunit PstC [Leptospiraceae bacterium]HMY34057.1 phosphate ABC transporter permease subunit PstC [Leptospiraceae bacterium]HMZ65724.1 phosphate ABC transporter permease subunit PstC [Leptospiraceae bacterium]
MADNNPKSINLLTQAVTSGDRSKIFSRYGKRPSYSLKEKLIRYILRSFSWVTIGVTLFIIGILFVDAIELFRRYSLIDFITGTEWEPFGESKKLGILPLVSGTLMIAFGASMISLPLGFGTAVYLTQYAGKEVDRFMTPIIEILSGIPTVVFGYFALFAVTPFLQKFFQNMELFNATSASIVVGISCIPLVSSISSEALRAVPPSIRNGAYAVGMNKFNVVTKVIVPSAISGIIASFILAFARAVGETMAVTLAAGASPNMEWNYFKGIQTMTAFIVQISLGDTPAGSTEYYTIYAVGLMLFLITFAFNLIATMIIKRYREIYK